MRLVKLFVLLSLLFASPALAANKYVSKLGTDAPGCGSAIGTDACLTITYALANSMSGGDTLHIQSGTYSEQLTITSALNGAPGAYTIIKSYDNDNVTIQYNSVDDEVILIYDASAAVEYIKFDGSGTDSGRHLEITTTDAYRLFQIKYANYIWIKNCSIHGARYYDGIKLTSKAHGTDSGGEDDDKGPKNCIIEYCSIYSNGDYGIKLTGWGTDSNTIRYNSIYNNGLAVGEGANKYGLNLSGSGYAANPPTGNKLYGNLIYGNGAFGLNILTCVDTEFYSNRVYSNGSVAAGRGVQVSTGSTGTLLYNNTIYNNTYYGIELSGDSAGSYVYNNLVYNNIGGGSEIKIQGTASGNYLYNNTAVSLNTASINVIYITSTVTGTTVKNNIAVSTGALYCYGFRSDTTDVVAANNNFYTSETGVGPVYLAAHYHTIAWMNDTWEGTAQDNISENPVFDSGYALTVGSSSGSGHVRDGGLDLSVTFTADLVGIARPQNGVWDMGALEYSGISGGGRRSGRMR